MGTSDHLTSRLRNLYAGQEATVRTRHGTMDWFQIGKGVCQGYILSPCIFNLYAEYLMRSAGLDNHKLESKFPQEISIISDMQMTPSLWQEWTGTKEPLDESERGQRKSWLKTQHSKNEDHGIWSNHFMANTWGNNGNWQTLFSWAPKSLQMVTIAMKLKDACSLEEKLWPT